MKLLPFDLAKALDGDPVVTRNGLQVIFLHIQDNIKKSNNLVGIIDSDGWNNVYSYWYHNGKRYLSCGSDNSDLFMADKTEEDCLRKKVTELEEKIKKLEEGKNEAITI